MLRCCMLFVALSATCSLSAADAPPEPAGMKQLFNGKDLTGWDGDTRLWSVKEGIIHGETTAENPANGNTFLIWKDGTLKDFDLRLSFRCNATNNSGIMYRSKLITEGVKNKWVLGGYQHEIRNETKFPNTSSFIYDERGLIGKRGRMCLVGEIATWDKDGKKVLNEGQPLIDQAGFEKLMKLDDWNDVVIIAKGPTIKHYLNGKQILEFTDNETGKAMSEGLLGVQLHAGKPMFAEFKNIRLKEVYAP